MSSKKIAFNGRTKVPRTRTGCHECRRRKLKCGEQRPSCQRCISSRVPCSYNVQLKWSDEPQNRRKPSLSLSASSPSPSPTNESDMSLSPSSTHGSSYFDRILTNLAGSSPSLSSFVNLTWDDFDLYYHHDRHPRSYRTKLGKGGPAVPTQPVATTHRQLQQGTVFSHGPLREAASTDQMTSAMPPPVTDIGTSHLINTPKAALGRTLDEIPYNLTSSDRRLLEYYVTSMCPKCSLLDRRAQSYRKIMVPIGMQSRLVFHAMLSLAASQLRSQVDDPRYHQTALQHHGFSLRQLSRCIAAACATDDISQFSKETRLQRLSPPPASSANPCSVTKTEVLGAILMLCLFETANDTFQASSAAPLNSADHYLRMHLRGARRILESPNLEDTSRGGDREGVKAVASFLSHFFTARNALLSTTRSSPPNSIVDSFEEEELLENVRYWSYMNARPVHEVNCFAGCSMELLQLITEIVAAVRATRNGRASWNQQAIVDVTQVKEDFAARLEDLVQSSSFSASHSDHASGVDNAACEDGHQQQGHTAKLHSHLLLADAYKQAAITLMHYLPGPPSAQMATTTGAAVGIIQQQEAVSNVIKCLDEIHGLTFLPSRGKVGRSSFCWPYFIIACHAKTDADRARILRTFEATVVRDPACSDVLVPLQGVITGVWSLQDLEQCSGIDGNGGLACLEHRDGSWCFPWERVMRHRGVSFNWL